MPTYTFISPKGGVGKTTSSLLFATQIAKRGVGVSIIDADPNYPIKKWAAGGQCPENVHVISDITENNIASKIREAAAVDPIVIVDLEGTAAKIVIHALQEADFIVIPMQGSLLDAEQAVKRHVQNYTLPYSILLTRTPPAYQTRNMTSLKKSFSDKGIPVFDTVLTEREAFRSMFFFQKPLDKLNSSEAPSIDKAIENADAFAAELISKLLPEG